MTTTCSPAVCYQYDETQPAALLFGPAQRVGNDIQFLPWDFYVLSEDGAGLSSAAGTFVFDRVYTVDGGEILSVEVREEGDYEIVGNGSVSAQLGLQVDSNVILADTTSSSSVFAMSSDSGGPDLWNLTAATWPEAAFTGPANDLKVSISNSLTANTSLAGQYAFIHKKFTLVTQWLPEVNVVPVPGAVWLLGSGLGVLGLLRRRGTAMAGGCTGSD